ncbi:MAG: hypothetical protein V3U87_13940 [Methylococcaceae bacterium]
MFFDTLADYAKKFDGKTGFTLKDAGIDQLYTQDGFYFAMRYMNAKIPASSVTKIDMGFENENGICQNCRLDLEISNTQGQTIRYEFKSYAKNTPMTQVPQFISYIEEANNLNSYKYVFNKDKVTLNQARNKMKTFINSNREVVFKAIRNNESLKSAITNGVPFNSAADLTPDLIDKIVNATVEVY